MFSDYSRHVAVRAHIGDTGDAPRVRGHKHGRFLVEKTLTWLHLSDLHLCPTKTGWDAQRVLDALKEDFACMQEEQGLRPDLIFFTGDVAYGQLPESSIQDQYEEAAILFDEIRTAFSPEIPKENLFIVPGNHDVNRDKVHKGPTALLDGYREAEDGIKRIEELLQKGADPDWEAIMDRLGDYRQFLAAADWKHLLDDPAWLCYAVTREIAGIEVGIVGLNSAWSCGRDREKGQIWLGGHWQIQTLHQKIKQAGIKIALAHHPLSWFDEGNKLETEMDGNFDFFLHGHEHNAWVDAGKRHIRIEGGACYERSDEENGYNFVRLNLEDGTGEVWLRRYESGGKGEWAPRVIPSEMPEGFWPLTNPGTLAQTGSDSEEQQGEASEIEEKAPPTLTDAESRGVFGRDADIKKLLRALRGKPIVAVYGMQGIGKTVLIQETGRAGKEFESAGSSFTVHPGATMPDLYRGLASSLGCRGEDVEPPEALLGTRDFSRLSRSARNAKPCLIHIKQAQELFGEHGFRDPDVGVFLEAVAERVPAVRVVLECREAPPDGLLPDVLFGRLRLSGLDSESVRAYFRRPFRDRPEVHWDLSEEDSQEICTRLGSKGGKKALAHPLGLVLLAGVSEGLDIAPLAAVLHHGAELGEELEQGLFSDLYDDVLNSAKRRMLRICALYRDYIPLRHAEVLEEAGGEHGAFDHLVRRCLLNSDEREERFYLHSMIAELTLRRAGDDAERTENHAQIAEAWKKGITSMVLLPNIIGASEAVYHFTEAGRFDRLSEFVDSVLARHLQQNLAHHLSAWSRRLKEAKRHEENRHVLELLVELAPNDPRHHRFLGETIEKLDGRGSAKALEHFQIAFRMLSDFPPYLAGLGACLLARGEAQAFIDLVDGLEEDVRSKAFNDHCRSIYADCMAQLGDLEEASRLRCAQIESGSPHPAFYNDEARYLLDKGKAPEALALLDKAEERNIANAFTRAIRATALEQSGDPEAASRLRCAQIESGSRDPAFYADEARYLLEKDKAPEALALLDKAEERNIANDFTRAIRATALEQSGDPEVASRLRCAQIEAGSRHPAFYNDEARYLLDKDKPSGALEILDKAEELNIADEYTRAIRARAERALEP